MSGEDENRTACYLRPTLRGTSRPTYGHDAGHKSTVTNVVAMRFNSCDASLQFYTIFMRLSSAGTSPETSKSARIHAESSEVNVHVEDSCYLQAFKRMCKDVGALRTFVNSSKLLEG